MRSRSLPAGARPICIALATLLVGAALTCSAGPRIVVCDQAEARIAVLDADRPWTDPAALLWQWRAREAETLAADERRWFEHPTDAKPVLDATHLLITASGGGVALLRIDDRSLRFRARAGGNPHSAELLPDGAVVSASSAGSFLKLWRVDRPDAPLQTVELLDAHGVTWDPRGRRLWALGRDELIAMSYAGHRHPEPLSVVERVTLPEGGGHDLGRSVPGRLVLSTYASAWSFDPASGAFTPYPGLASIANLKSVSEPSGADPVLPTLAVRADERWWSDTVRSTSPGWSRTLPGARLYKARWMDVAVATGAATRARNSTGAADRPETATDRSDRRR